MNLIRISLTRHIVIILLFLSAFLLCGACTAATTTVTIIANPRPFISVQEAAVSEEKVNFWDDDLTDDRACTESFAAMELAKFLPKCINISNRFIHISSSPIMPDDGDVFLIGSRKSNPLIASLNLPESNDLTTDESFRIHTFSQGQRTITVIEGSDRIGALYGTYRYLEQLGIRFYGLGETGTVYPAVPAEIPAKLDITENPSYFTRGFITVKDCGSEDFFLWMVRNHMNLWTSAEKEVHYLKKLGMKLSNGGHTIQTYFLNPNDKYPYNHPKFTGDEDKPNDPYPSTDEYAGDVNNDGSLSYFEAHPEWYGLYNGKRSSRINGGSGDNYCTSNMDATKELAKNLIQSLIDGQYKHVDLLDFWTLDGGSWCQCEKCSSQGTYTDRLLNVLHTVYKEIEKARQQGRLKRPVQLATLAYLETLAPPTRPLPEDFDYNNCFVTFFPIGRCYAHPFADPACTEVNRYFLESYQGWTTGQGRFYKGNLLVGEYYNVSSLRSLPVVYTRIMSTDIPWYYRTGTRHLHYMHTPLRLWGTWTLNQYLLASLLWNADDDADKLLDEYFKLYYPTTYEHTRSFYENLEKATANIKAFKHLVQTTHSSDIYSRKQFYAPLSRGKEVLTNKNLEIFPLKHMKFEPYHPQTNDGPDVTEMVDFMQKAGIEIDAALKQCTNEKEKTRLLEDQRRFAYGQAMINFGYHIFRTTIFHHQSDSAGAAAEFKYVDEYAKKLEGITDLVQVSSGGGADANNALIGSALESVVEFFRKNYAGKNRSDDPNIVCEK